jgi:hypothetical protein
MKRELIYLAHSMLSYGTEKEKQEVLFLRKRFPNYRILNPAKYTNVKDMSFYLEKVAQSAMVVASEIDGYISKGVFSEISRALSDNIPVKVIRPIDGGYKLFRISGFDVFDENDWKSKYAQLTIFQ